MTAWVRSVGVAPSDAAPVAGSGERSPEGGGEAGVQLLLATLFRVHVVGCGPVQPSEVASRWLGRSVLLALVSFPHC